MTMTLLRRPQIPGSGHASTASTIGLLLAAYAAVSCGGGGGGGDSAPPQGITPRVEVLGAVSVDAREGLLSESQTLLVSNNGVVGTYSWDVVVSGGISASAALVPGGVEVRFSARGGSSGGGVVPQEIEVRFCAAAPCTTTNSLRRIVPVRVNLIRGLSWRPPPALFYGGLGLGVATEEPRFTIGVPSQAGSLEVDVIPIPGWTSSPGWLIAMVEPGPADFSRVIRLSVPGAAGLGLGEYGARLRARYTFADGTAPLELTSDFLLQVRAPGCRLPESSPSSPQDYGIRIGPNWAGLTSSLTIRIECWGIEASAARFDTGTPWLRTGILQSPGLLEVNIELDPDAAATLPAQVEASLQLRISSPVQDDVLIPFSVAFDFPDVLAATPSTIPAGTPAEVTLSGVNLNEQLLPVLYDAAGLAVESATLRNLRQLDCQGPGGCKVVILLPPLAAGDWSIGFVQPPGVQRPRGLVRVTAP